ncbi:unnamed protein product [Natator depressus]
MYLKIGERFVPFLVDTGATLSSLIFVPGSLSNTKVWVQGIEGNPCPAPLSCPVPVELGSLKLSHRFVVMPEGPANLLGRDVLSKLGAHIYCAPEGLRMSVPDSAVASLMASVTPIPDLPTELSSVSPNLWSMSSTDVGLLKSATPVSLQGRDGPPPSVKQYPLPKEAEEGISLLISSYLSQKVLVPCSSPCHTPILPVKKPKPGPDGHPVYRFVQDLHAINSYVITLHPVVPDPSTILTLIPQSATCFMVVDLCAAFFSIPLHPDSQYLFVFTWGGQQLTWTRLPQGFSGSPTIFSQILADDLKDIVLPGSSVLVQYVDDLLIASSDYNACLADSITLLTALANKGHRASPSKLQLCRTQVIYLGFAIRPGERLLSPDRVQAIQDYPLPTTKKQLRAFLGAAGFCRHWTVAFGELVKPLVQATTTSNPNPVLWALEMEAAFVSTKKALISAPALGLLDYSKPFFLFSHEQRGVASGVLLQYLGDRPRPIAYYSVQLDPVIRGSVSCVWSIATAALMVERSRPIVLGHPLTVWVPHEVEILLKQHTTQALSPQRARKYELILLAADNITLCHCNVLNPATLTPLPEDGTPHHVCMDVVPHYTDTPSRGWHASPCMYGCRR